MHEYRSNNKRTKEREEYVANRPCDTAFCKPRHNLFVGDREKFARYKGTGDYDKDGLKNGEEIEIIEENGKLFVIEKSSPVKADTDDDGVNDKRDASPKDKFNTSFKAVNNYNHIPHCNLRRYTHWSYLLKQLYLKLHFLKRRISRNSRQMSSR